MAAARKKASSGLHDFVRDVREKATKLGHLGKDKEKDFKEGRFSTEHLYKSYKADMTHEEAIQSELKRIELTYM